MVWKHQVYQGLDYGMVGGIHMGIKWKRTFPVTIKCSIPFWCYDPVLPSQISETHIEFVLLAGLFLFTGIIISSTGHPGGVLMRVGFIAVLIFPFAGCSHGSKKYLACLEEGHHEWLF